MQAWLISMQREARPPGLSARLEHCRSAKAGLLHAREPEPKARATQADFLHRLAIVGNDANRRDWLHDHRLSSLSSRP